MELRKNLSGLVGGLKDLILENEQNDVVDTDNTAFHNMVPEEDVRLQRKRRSRGKKICLIAAKTCQSHYFNPQWGSNFCGF